MELGNGDPVLLSVAVALREGDSEPGPVPELVTEG